ncbi:MAG: DUF5348 domain-containing protein [Acetatifactor muris]|nr:DUF5348 domain-containing protein [Acetatifactor muris]
MAELSMALVQVEGLKYWIDDILNATTFDEHADLRGLHADHRDSEQLFQLRELKGIMRKLADIGGSIEYLFRPVRETGTLHRDGNGEYQTGQGYRYRSGSMVEFLLADDSGGVPCWTVTKVEHDGEDYYLMGYEDIPMEGLSVRVR